MKVVEPVDRAGRFGPPGSYPVMYLMRDDPQARVELRRWSEAAADGGSRLVLVALEVSLRRILDLTDPQNREALDVSLSELLDPHDMSLARSVGVAAYERGLEGIAYPRPRGFGAANLAVFLERAGTNSIVIVSLDSLSP